MGTARAAVPWRGEFSSAGEGGAGRGRLTFTLLLQEVRRLWDAVRHRRDGRGRVHGCREQRQRAGLTGGSGAEGGAGLRGGDWG